MIIIEINSIMRQSILNPNKKLVKNVEPKAMAIKIMMTMGI